MSFLCYASLRCMHFGFVISVSKFDRRFFDPRVRLHFYSIIIVNLPYLLCFTALICAIGTDSTVDVLSVCVLSSLSRRG